MFFFVLPNRFIASMQTPLNQQVSSPQQSDDVKYMFGPALYNQNNQVIKITHRASDSISCISVMCYQCPVLFLMEYVKKQKKQFCILWTMMLLII